MKIQSNLFDRFVRFASRNLTGEEEERRLNLNVGEVVSIEGTDTEFMILSWSTSEGTGTPMRINVELGEVIKGKVEYK